MKLSIQTRLPWQPHTSECPCADGTGTGSRLSTAFHCYPQYSDSSGKGTFTLHSIVLPVGTRSILTDLLFLVWFFQVNQSLRERGACRKRVDNLPAIPSVPRCCYQRGTLADHLSGLVTPSIDLDSVADFSATHLPKNFQAFTGSIDHTTCQPLLWGGGMEEG